MTDANLATDADVPPVTDPASPPDPGESEHDPGEDDSAKPGSEAARYRRRLREAEAERDTLAGRVAEYQSREVRRLVADELAQPDDLFAFGVTLNDLLDDGEVSEGLVATALAGVLTARPGLAKVEAPRRPDLGQGTRPVPKGGTSWGEVLRR
jgi:hypothetical protein